MASTAQPQTTIYETEIENPDLERVLETREKLKEKKGESVKQYKTADDQAKALIEGLDLGEDAPVRVGRFVVKRTSVASRSVAFETDPTSRLQIRLLPEDV